MMILTDKDKMELMSYIQELPFKHAQPLIAWFAGKEKIAEHLKDVPVVKPSNEDVLHQMPQVE